jgi:hypothetical protein
MNAIEFGGARRQMAKGRGVATALAVNNDMTKVHTIGESEMVVYRIETDVVSPVFYPIVPDAFMTSATGDGPRHLSRAAGSDWEDESDTPLLSPHDPWSF